MVLYTFILRESLQVTRLVVYHGDLSELVKAIPLELLLFSLSIYLLITFPI